MVGGELATGDIGVVGAMFVFLARSRIVHRVEDAMRHGIELKRKMKYYLYIIIYIFIC